MVSDLNTVGETGLLWLRLKKPWQSLTESPAVGGSMWEDKRALGQHWRSKRRKRGRPGGPL